MPEVADKIKFYIGDVRDLSSVKGAMHSVDYIFHAAALKQLPSCEFFPMEAVRTNVIGKDIGYADGFWRSNWKKPYAILVNGKLSLITGHVCMEQMMVDVSNIECELERV